MKYLGRKYAAWFARAFVVGGWLILLMKLVGVELRVDDAPIYSTVAMIVSYLIAPFSWWDRPDESDAGEQGKS